MTNDISFLLILIFNFFLSAFAIDCFKCISLNKDYPPCEDPFHNNYTLDIFQSPCMAGRKGRDGQFPATSCVKINGLFDDTGEYIVVRGCALDSGTLTTDTELVRMSHCGRFYYDGRKYKNLTYTMELWHLYNILYTMLNKYNNSILFNEHIMMAIIYEGNVYDTSCRYVRGCVQTCNDADACNTSVKLTVTSITLVINLLLLLI